MYPHVRQLRTRWPKLESERQPVRNTERAGRARAVAGAPPRYKLAVLTWAGAYALITLILALLGPAMASWPLVLRTFVISVTMVAVLTWLVMPRLTRLFRTWLNPGV